jgi:RecB family exonuclease
LTDTKKPDYVSFSSIKDWKFCPFYYKLTRIDGVRAGRESIHTAFGKALHSTLEKVFAQEKEDSFDYSKDFSSNFSKEISALAEDIKKTISEKDIKDFDEQGKELAQLAYPAAKQYFGDFEFISAEENLMEDIEEYKIDDFKFKGYIDLVLRSKTDKKYHIIDWKTTSWGWEPQKKNDAMTTYQLTYYKHFLAKKINTQPENIETHFGLLKRTAKKDKVELFRVSSGEKKVNNALKLLQECVHNVDHERFVKNRLSCTKCSFHKTSHCP